MCNIWDCVVLRLYEDQTAGSGVLSLSLPPALCQPVFNVSVTVLAGAEVVLKLDSSKINEVIDFSRFFSLSE